MRQETRVATAKITKKRNQKEVNIGVAREKIAGKLELTLDYMQQFINV